MLIHVVSILRTAVSTSSNKCASNPVHVLKQKWCMVIQQKTHSCRILVRTTGCHTSHLDPHCVSSTWPRKRDTAERSPPSCLHFLQGREPTHSIDAGPTVTCLVRGHAAESLRVGRYVEHLCRCKGNRSSRFAPEGSQRLVGARACSPTEASAGPWRPIHRGLLSL